MSKLSPILRIVRFIAAVPMFLAVFMLLFIEELVRAILNAARDAYRMVLRGVIQR